eukprot:15457311-Alexandrium_andersonii.AAC.1
MCQHPTARSSLLRCALARAKTYSFGRASDRNRSRANRERDFAARVCSRKAPGTPRIVVAWITRCTA